MNGERRNWPAYLLPSSAKSDVIAAGGTYRFDLDETARKVIAKRAFTRGCMDLENGSDSVAHMISNDLDETPTEAHVFWSLASGKPFFVSMKSSLWTVENGKLELDSRNDRKH